MNKRLFPTLSVLLWTQATLVFASANSALKGQLPLPFGPSDASQKLWDVLGASISEDPFNLFSAIIFFLAIVHTFLTAIFRKWSVQIQERHIRKLIAKDVAGKEHKDVSFLSQIFYYLGEVEAVFSIWVLVLMVGITYFFSWDTAKDYISHRVNYTEPLFVFVIMTMAATRPILNFSENMLRIVAKIGKSTPLSWWFAILVLAPVLGSLITEPAAMTIAALLLGKQFYVYKPSRNLRYATLGVLFVNISVGGTLTNFAAPPVLMVAQKWGWSTMFMLEHFGWKSCLGILLTTFTYYFYFRKEFTDLYKYKLRSQTDHSNIEVTSDDLTNLVPFWVVLAHVLFMAWTVYSAHYPPLFLGGFIFFVGFMQMTKQHQNKLDLHGPILVGFFLAGLVIHGGLQGWWIAPVLGRLGELPLMLAATTLTAVNDNAAITYLSTLVPGLTDALKFAVVSGAVIGGGLTVIANAPNPAGQNILSRHFPNKSIHPMGLFLGALPPTVILFLLFYIFS